jgi:hypothetical protein
LFNAELTPQDQLIDHLFLPSHPHNPDIDPLPSSAAGWLVGPGDFDISPPEFIWQDSRSVSIADKSYGSEYADSNTTSLSVTPSSHQLSESSTPREDWVKDNLTPSSSQTEPASMPVTTNKLKRKRNREDSECMCFLKDNMGNSVGSMQVHAWLSPIEEPGRTQKKMTDDERRRYALNRKLKACKTCRARKKRCNRSRAPYVVCLTSKQPIFLARPNSARLFRPKPANDHPLFSEGKGIYDLEDLCYDFPPTVELEITHGFGKTLIVHAGEFEAHSRFKTKHVWMTKHGRREHGMRRLCLVDMRRTKDAVNAYINHTSLSFFAEIFQKSSKLVKSVLHEARQYSQNNKNSIVGQALFLLAVIRMIEKDWTIVDSSAEAIGEQPVSDEESPWYKKVPIIPVMDTQLDQVVIRSFLTPLREKVMNMLQEKMEQGRKEDWYDIFLTVFILTTNTELLLRHSRKNAIRYGAKHRYNSIHLAQDYFHSTNILLAHFHHLHNGSSPLHLGTDGKEPESIEGLLDHQVTFLRTLRQEMHARSRQLQDMRRKHRYEDELFWSHQMFFPDWIPEDRNIVDDV